MESRKGKQVAGGPHAFQRAAVWRHRRRDQLPLTVVVYLLMTPRMFSRLTSTLETVLMPPWALAAEMEESPTATRPRK